MGNPKRCNECAKRHVKCDRRKPTCRQCEAAAQPCTWTSDEQSKDVEFFMENAFASGSVHRPRGPRKAASIRHLEATKATNLPASTAQHRIDSCQAVESTALYVQPRVPILDNAIAKYSHTFLRYAKASRSELEGFLANYGTIVGTSDFQTIVSSALSAVALVYFGRSHNSQQAILSGQRCYQTALLGTRTKIQSLTGPVSDPVLLTVLLLASYEDKVGNYLQSDPLPNSYRHLQSAAAFLPDRQHQPRRTESSLLLDEIVWRRAINIAINRGSRLDDSVRKYVQSHKSLSQQLLFDCMVDLAEVNVDMRNALSKETGADKMTDLTSVLHALQALHGRLESVCTTLVAEGTQTIHQTRRDDQSCALRPILQRYYNLTCYATMNDAYDLALCAASLLRVADMIVRTIRKNIPLDETADLDDDASGLLEISLQSVRRHVAEVFATVPYHFGVVNKPAKTEVELCENADALLVGRLTFPLHAVGQAFSTTLKEKAIAKKLLLLGSQVTANMVLPALYSNDGPFRLPTEPPG